MKLSLATQLLLVACSVTAIGTDESVALDTENKKAVIQTYVQTSSEITGSGADAKLTLKLTQRAKFVNEIVSGLEIGDVFEMFFCGPDNAVDNPICTVWQVTRTDSLDTMNMLVYESKTENIARDTESPLPTEQFLYLAGIDDDRPKAQSDYTLVNQVVFKLIQGIPRTATDKRYTGPFSIDADETLIQGQNLQGTRVSTITDAAAIDATIQGGTFEGLIGVYYRSKDGKVAQIEEKAAVYWQDSSAVTFSVLTVAAVMSLTF